MVNTKAGNCIGKQCVEVMPEHYFSHDRQWIREQLSLLSTQMRKRICEKYSEVYHHTLTTSTNELNYEGEARFEANTRLRLYVQKVKAPSQGAVSMPPKVKRRAAA